MKQQDELLQYIRRKYPITPEVAEAFMDCPRHLFINRSYSLDEMYKDYPLEIYHDDNYVSTISQPSFVLLMIEMLKLEPQHRVIELGGGSGWNAALMSCLCSLVVSIEIIPDLANETRENLKKLGYNNVVLIEGDGANGCAEFAPYDRGIFTAGATDLPKAFHEQIKVGGLLLFVMKTSIVDYLLLLKKEEGYFEELERLPCSFVPMKGRKKARGESIFTTLSQEDGRIRIYPAEPDEGKDSVFSVT